MRGSLEIARASLEISRTGHFEERHEQSYSTKQKLFEKLHEDSNLQNDTIACEPGQSTTEDTAPYWVSFL